MKRGNNPRDRRSLGHINQNKFAAAFALHQQGSLIAAKAAYEGILQLQPNHFDALHLLGVIELHFGNADLALSLIDRAITLHPQHAAYHANRGMALRALGRLEEAVTSYDKALAINPAFLEALYNRGNALGDLDRLDDAIASFDMALAIQPDLAEANYHRGNALRGLGRHADALASYDKTIALNPRHADAHFNRGLVLRSLDRPTEALACFDQAIAIKPDYIQAYLNRGTLLKDLGRKDEASANYHQAIALKPDYADAYYNLGVVYREQGHRDQALVCYEMAITLKQEFPEALLNRSKILGETGRYSEAATDIDKAIELRPDFAEAYSNRGNLLKALGKSDEAMACYDKAISLKPGFSMALFNKALLLLLNGEFEKGWPLYESRWASGAFKWAERNFVQPLWLGKESLRGKTILLYAEQGLGDTIQFSRYARKVADLGAQVLLEIQNPLHALLQGLDERVRLVAIGDALPPFDYQCPLLTLPLAFATNLHNIPCTVRYLNASPDKIKIWAIRLGERNKPRIGLVWSGNAQHANDANRSIALSKLLAELPSDFDYFSLQKELRPTDIPTFQAASNLRHFGDELVDFSDTAALCSQMDVVVSVDTSVAHLSAAMGLPTWIFLPADPDWRWLMNREDSPWYPTVRLFRQSVPGDWEDAIKRASTALSEIQDD